MNYEKLRTNFQERVAHTKFFTLSLVIHIAVVVVFGGMVIIHSHQSEPEFASNGAYQFEELDLTTHSREPEPQPTMPEVKTAAVAVPELKSAKVPDVIKSSRGESHALPGLRMNLTNLDIAKVDTFVSVSSPKIGGEMGLRFMRDGSGHIMMGGARGSGPTPTKATEEAVMRGLAWLQKVQNADGSWGERNRGAMTGLALLCFLGHGEYGQSPQFGFTVNHALEWIVANGTASQSRLSMSRDGWGSGNAGVYEHGIATYALGEYYTMTMLAGSPDERVVELFRGAVRHIIDGQGPDGGWMYDFNKTQSDTSVSGWQVQALKTAHLSGLKIPGVDTALDRAMLNFQRVQTERGGYGYRKAEDRWSLTGVGVLCELFWRSSRDAGSRRSVEFIMAGLDANPLRYDHERADLYAWYYHTQALLMFGNQAWKKWEALMSRELVKSQAPDGSWPVMANPAHGGLQKESSTTGAVYRTALSVLMLESYYRYLPANRS
ncbi:MAG: hypothetical protein RL088_3154 [Verrucomicrobiota bacterium]|jgi:hypothetical protein